MTSTQTRDEIIRDTKLVKRFVQSQAGYKTSTFERNRAEGYAAARRIAQGFGWPAPENFGALVAILDLFGVGFKTPRHWRLAPLTEHNQRVEASLYLRRVDGTSF